MAGTDSVANDAGRWRSGGSPGDGRRAPGARRRPRSDRIADAVWIGILVAAGSFQFGRGAPIEGVPFALGALALAADGLGWLRRADVVVPRPRAPRWTVVVGIVLAAALVAIAPEFGWLAAVLVAAAGLAAVAPSWGRRDPVYLPEKGARRGIRRAALCWAAVAVALCLWELGSFFAGLPSARADWEHPALSDLVKPALGVPLARAALFACWLAAGWALVGLGWGTTKGEPEQDGGAS